MVNSLRFRLTVWYLALFSLLFVLFSVFLYAILARDLQNRMDETLSSAAGTAASLFADELDEVKGDAAQAALEVVSEMRPGGGGIAILEHGRVLAASAAGLLPLIQTIAAEAKAGAPPGAILPVERPGTSGARAAVRKLEARGRSFLIVALEPLDSVAADLRVVRRVVLFSLPLLLGLAGMGGFALARRSLAPLGRMAEQTRRITDANLDTRVQLGGAAEELAVLAASFNDLLARLDQSFEAMRRFVADASHELRTPVSVIRGEADVALSRERGAEEYRESLAIVLDESRRLSRLVDDLLNLARADAGRVRLQVEDFYFNDLLADCCRRAQSQARARQIHLECVSGEEDAPFRGDQGLLRRLLLNLIDNAIRYTPAGGRVTVSLDAQGPQMRVRVSDTGIGVAPEAAPHVFERFYRGDKARARQDGGFGLGLSIVKWIAESHHGTVELASHPGAGTTFTVTLPRHGEG